MLICSKLIRDVWDFLPASHQFRLGTVSLTGRFSLSFPDFFRTFKKVHRFIHWIFNWTISCLDTLLISSSFHQIWQQLEKLVFSILTQSLARESPVPVGAASFRDFFGSLKRRCVIFKIISTKFLMEHYPDAKRFEAECLSCLTNSYLSDFLHVGRQVWFLWRDFCVTLKRRFIKLCAEFLTGY